MKEEDKKWFVVASKSDIVHFECETKEEAEQKKEELDVNHDVEICAVPKSKITYSG